MEELGPREAASLLAASSVASADARYDYGRRGETREKLRIGPAGGVPG